MIRTLLIGDTRYKRYSPPAPGHDVHAHGHNSRTNHIQLLGGGEAQIDKAVRDPWATIVDHDDYMPPVFLVRHLEKRAEWQASVGARHSVHVIPHAAGGFSPVETSRIIRGFPFIRRVHGRPGIRIGTTFMNQAFRAGASNCKEQEQ